MPECSVSNDMDGRIKLLNTLSFCPAIIVLADRSQEKTHAKTRNTMVQLHSSEAVPFVVTEKRFSF